MLLLAVLNYLMPAQLGALGSGWPLFAIGAVIGLIAGLIVLATSRMPTTLDAARLSDRLMQSGERFSTAHDVTARGQSGVVAQALLDDVVVAAETIEPRGLVPIPVVRFALPVVAQAGLLALGLTLLPQAAPVEIVAEAPAAPPAELVDDERTALAVDIARVASFMAGQADDRRDDYARAVARTLENLASRLEAGGEISRDELAGELANLGDYATAATSQWRGTAGQRIPELLAALADRVQQPPVSPEAEMQPSPETGMPAGEQAGDMPAGGDQQQQQVASSKSPSTQPADDFNSMMDQAEASVKGTAEAPAAEPGLESPRVSASYLDIAKAQNEAEMAASGAQAGMESEIIGPSSNAQAGDSLLAGEGTDALGNVPMADLELHFDVGEQVTLEATDTGEGQRIEKSVTPPTQRSVVADPADLSTMAAWTRTPEAEVGRSQVDPSDRDFVSAYRMGLKAQAEE